MPFPPQFNDLVFQHLNELTSRVVAESGKPNDRFHLGKIILQSLKDAPDFVLQIDGTTGESETCKSVLERSIKCATALKNYGVAIGDVIMFMEPNQLDIAVIMYAALYNGQIIFALNSYADKESHGHSFSQGKPKVVVCQSEKLKQIQELLYKHNQEALLLTFDDSPNSLQKFCEEFGSDLNPTEFRVTDFDPVESLSFIYPTSGSTDAPKLVAVTHTCMMSRLPYRLNGFDTFSKPPHSVLLLSKPLRLNFIATFLYSSIFRIQRILTPAIEAKEHIHQVIRKFKPTILLSNPNYLTALVRADAMCDFTSFQVIRISGINVLKGHVETIKAAAPNVFLLANFGMSESTMAMFGLCETGQPISMQLCRYLCTKFVDIDSGVEITEANKVGEMWVKGPSVFKGYFKNDDETKNAFSKDGWFKTGELFYRDQNHNYFYVARKNMIIYYKGNHVYPLEIEAVIKEHPGVMQAAVIGLPDADDYELPMACVSRRQGYDVTADDIKAIVKDSLADSSHLRGGVIFMSTVPHTPTHKVDYKKIKETFYNFARE